MPFASVPGTRLYYEESGPLDGRPMLLLHAALQTGESMAPLVKVLAPLGLRLIRPDLRGHGRSANPGRTISVPQLATDITRLIEHLGHERPLAAGYSLGGIVGLELATQGRLGGLVVLASRIHTAARGREAFDPGRIQERSPLWATQLAERHVEIAWSELAVELGEMLSTWSGFSREALASINVPLLVVQGDRDQMVPLDQARELAAAVTDAELQVVPRAGHPELLYRQETLKAVTIFLQKLA